MSEQMPKNVAGAIQKLRDDLGLDELEKLRQFIKDDLILLHHGFGTGIRNDFGLWGFRNPRLIMDIGRRNGCLHLLIPMHPDDTSQFLIETLWQQLQDNQSDPQ